MTNIALGVGACLQLNCSPTCSGRGEAENDWSSVTLTRSASEEGLDSAIGLRFARAYLGTGVHRESSANAMSRASSLALRVSIQRGQFTPPLQQMASLRELVTASSEELQLP